jgi:serine O-acetyltransferase
MIIEDLNRYSSTLMGKIKISLLSPSFHIVLLYRISSFFAHRVPFIGNLVGIVVEYISRVLYSTDISRYAKIDGGLIIMHGMGIVIGKDVVIGKNCKILNGVNLGNKETEIPNNQQPRIGNNVVIGAGAKCLGDVIIGNNVKIGANAVVLTDIPDNSIAVGIPAKIIEV